MPAPRSVGNWPSVGERRSLCVLQYTLVTTDTMGGRSESFEDFGTWFAKVTVVPFIVSDTQSALLYDIEGPYRADMMTKFLAGIGLRVLVNDMTLKVFQVENPQLRNRTLVAHCAPAVNVQ